MSSPPSLFRIRRAEPADARALFEINDRAIRISAAEHYTSDQREAWAGQLTVEARARTIADTIVFVAVVGESGEFGRDAGRAIGFSNLVAADAELDLLFVDPAFGGRGAARALVAAVEEAAVRHHVREVHTRASLRAEPVFARLGYRVVEREERQFNGQVFARAHMAKVLR